MRESQTSQAIEAEFQIHKTSKELFNSNVETEQLSKTGKGSNKTLQGSHVLSLEVVPRRPEAQPPLIRENANLSPSRSKIQIKKRPKKAQHQIQAIKDKITKSKMSMMSQFPHLAKGTKVQEDTKLKKFKGWKGLDSSSSSGDEEADDLRRDLESEQDRRVRQSVPERPPQLTRGTEESRNVFVTKIRRDETKGFEFENNPMMEVKLRNMTEMSMFDNLQSNMFGHAAAKRQSESRLEKGGRVAETKMRLIENIQKAVEQETLLDVSFSQGGRATRRTGESTNQRNRSLPAGSCSMNATERKSGLSHEYYCPSAGMGMTATSNMKYASSSGQMKKLHTNRNGSLQAVNALASKTYQLKQSHLPPISASQSKHGDATTKHAALEYYGNEPDDPAAVGMNQDLYDANGLDFFVTEQRGPVPPTLFTRVHKAPQSLLLSKSSVMPGTDFVNEDLLHFYPPNLPQQRGKEKQNQIFGTKSLKKEFGYFKQLQNRHEGAISKVEVAAEAGAAGKDESRVTMATEKTAIRQ